MKDENAPHEVERLLQERFHQWQQPFICPFCGKTKCKNFLHFVKLATLPRSYLRPKHFFLLYGLFLIIVLLVTGIYFGFQMLTHK